MSANVFSLPAALMLLIHLHILQYPHANKPEYDHSIFDLRVRGLRDRTRTMEDVCYFLVARIEGSKELLRKVFPTYPCLQPADTMAFRSSLAKFLETLRHKSLFPNDHGKQTQLGSKTPSKSLVANGAWWWKDIVVRKSLLEECGGERFERLLLALSTNALFKGSATQVGPDETQALLRGQPRIYMTRLAAFQSRQNSWARAASRLIQQQLDLKVLRANVVNFKPTKYASLSTEKLRALADSKLQDLLAVQWTAPGGHSALKSLAELYGLAELEPLSTTAPSRSTQEYTDATEVPITPPPPLPIAAAHHPATLRKLSKRIFPKVTPDSPSEALSRVPRLHAAVALAGSIDAEARMLQALTDAVARARKATPELIRDKLKSATIRPLRAVNLNLWHDPHQIRIDFEPTLSDGSFVALGLAAPGAEEPIQSHVDAIREALQPEYPPISTATAPLMSTSTQLPQLARQRSPPQTPRPARRLETSTPPATIKPRAQPLDTHRGARDHRPSLVNTSRSDSESESERPGAATPRARPKHSLTMTPPIGSSLLTHPLEVGYNYDDDDDDDDDFGPLGEGPSMSVRDLLLQADTTHFNIIADDSSDFDDQSFGWA
ncbi:hypothetical protein DFH09DRAFT_1201236 [Mycena vulgaris]|nr:hypothetical protein DFH09DRAFT_1201236 [Mycena vulgaris]